MGLNRYRRKRRFKETPEPKGRAVRAKSTGLLYVVQKHDASRLHYDFRLELDGVLKSWAVPKGPSLDPRRKALAVQVEDHPIEYGDFEGIIPEGQYGGGTVLLWDTGTWQPLHDPAEGLKDGKLHFVLHGQKLEGEWNLVRMHGQAGGGGKNWLLIKLQDKYASSDRDVLTDAPGSVKTSRSLAQIAGEADEVWGRHGRETRRGRGSGKTAWPEDFSPQLAVLAEAPPVGDQWVHEIKFDGYRLLAKIQEGKASLVTRHGEDWTEKFPGVAHALEKLKVDSAIVDGEAVVLDGEGRSDFQALQGRLKNLKTAEPIYMAFDLPFCDGVDLRQLPLIERKERLKKMLDKSRVRPRVDYSDHVRGHGGEVEGKACRMGLEGIVSKRADSPYVSRRDPTWRKSKCGQRQEFVVIGYTPPGGSRKGFGSLLLGYYDAGRLIYAGRVGAGFSAPLLLGTFNQLKKLRRDRSPTASPLATRLQSGVEWVDPTLVAEVRFTSWTRDGRLRHPVFVAFRSDKPAAQIVREKPVKPGRVEVLMDPSTRPSKRQPSRPTREAMPKAAAAKSPGGDFVVAGVTVTHPDKVLDEKSGVTKKDLAEYYQAAAEWMLPHVAGRPLALLRCPDGAGGKCFFQRNWSENLPAAVGKVDVGEGKSHEYHVAIRDRGGLISLAQIGVMEVHTWNCAAADVERPDQLVFDLDPGPGLAWGRVVEGMRRLKRVLEPLGLPTFLKTSGGKGLHVTIPIVPNVDWASAKSFCATIAKSMAGSDTRFVANMRKDLRGGKIYVDYNRNGRSATAVAPYSSRARAGAPVAMPISWAELGKMESADHFTVKSAGRYLRERKSDPWREFERSRVDLRALLGKKSVA